MPFRNVSVPVKSYSLSIDYIDAGSLVDASTINTGDIRIIGPNGFSEVPNLLAKTPASNSQTIVAIYRLATGFATAVNNGTYSVILLAGTVSDTEGNSVAQRTIGTFQVSIN